MIKTDGKPTIAWAPIPPAQSAPPLLPDVDPREVAADVRKALRGIDTTKDGWFTQYLNNLNALQRA